MNLLEKINVADGGTDRRLEEMSTLQKLFDSKRLLELVVGEVHNNFRSKPTAGIDHVDSMGAEYSWTNIDGDQYVLDLLFVFNPKGLGDIAWSWHHFKADATDQTLGKDNLIVKGKETITSASSIATVGTGIVLKLQKTLK